MLYKISIVVCLLTLSIACQNTSNHDVSDTDTTYVDDDEPVQDTIELFSGGRFRNVVVEKVNDSTFRLSGEAQVFEAAFSWVLEDGEREIKQGHSTTDAGAPAWGKFSFEVSVPEQDPGNPVQIILFEASPKDGTRQHELPIVLSANT
jgi:hypothetical protein